MRVLPVVLILAALATTWVMPSLGGVALFNDEMAFNAWMYPRAEIRVKGGGRGGFGETLTFGYSAMMSTKDSMDDVIKFYEAKLFQDTPPALLKRGIPTTSDFNFSHGLNGVSLTINEDSSRRPLRLRTYDWEGPNSSVSVVISRGKDEPQTHIILHYRGRTGVAPRK